MPVNYFSVRLIAGKPLSRQDNKSKSATVTRPTKAPMLVPLNHGFMVKRRPPCFVSPNIRALVTHIYSRTTTTTSLVLSFHSTHRLPRTSVYSRSERLFISTQGGRSTFRQLAYPCIGEASKRLNVSSERLPRLLLLANPNANATPAKQR